MHAEMTRFPCSWRLPRPGRRWLSQPLDQLLEILPLAKRVQRQLGREGAGGAVALVDGLSQHGHSLVGLGLRLGGRYASAGIIHTS
jgi:hypothetical protein